MKKRLLVATLVAIGPLLALAQNVITGRVIDAKTGEPLIGASVIVKTDRQGVATDADGNFSLTTKKEFPLTLHLDFIGYRGLDLDVYDNSEPVEIKLQENYRFTEEIVVIGYGQQKRSDLTGSLVSLKADDFNKGVYSSVDQLLQGTTPGLNIQQSSSEPGGGVNVRIRGNSSINAGSSPLYVIDGVPVDNSTTLSASSGQASIANINTAKNPLNTLNPSDIESVEVLKDASATAIYGSRAANGVILIQTKQGKAGRTKIDYTFEAGIQNAAKKIGVLSAQEYISVQNAQAIERGESAPFSAQDAAQIGNGTDWQDEVLHTAFVQRHNVSFSGGSEKNKYYISGTYLNQDGIVKNTGTEKLGARINLSSKLSNKIQIGLNLNTSKIEDSNFVDGNGYNEQGGPVYTALQYDPTEVPYDNEGNLTQSKILTTNNPVGIIEGVSNKTVSTRSLGTFYFQYEPLTDLKIKLNIGADLQNVRRDIYNSSKTIRGSASNGLADISTLERSDYVTELTADYSRKLTKKLSLNALVGTTYQHFQTRTFGASEGDFPSDDLLTNNLQLGNTSTASLRSKKETNALLSYFARTNFNYDDRYLLTASIRADGSSRFGENNRFGYFPSFALGWNLNNEKFISDFFESLKLRVSYGLTGNQDIGNYQSIRTYSTGGTFVSGSSYAIGVAPSRIANPDLKWESTAQFNVGIDAAILKGRLSASLDYFVKNTYDMLIAQPLPQATGYSSIYRNLGSLRNSGIEFLISAGIIEKKDFSWNVSFNLATLKNKVTDLGDVSKILTASLSHGGSTVIIEEGSPAFSFYGYNVVGIFKTDEEVKNSAQPTSQPGYPIFEDVNNDGRIDANDQKIIGSPYPNFSYGFHSDLRWKRFTLSFLLQGQSGGKVLNGNILESLYPSNDRRNLLSELALNRWTVDNPDAKWPSGIRSSNYGGGIVNSLELQDASYLRLKFIQLGYDLPIRKNSFIQGASLYVNAQNLFTISDYLGYDPEASTFGENSSHVDINAYPLARTVSFGINLSF